MSAGTVGRRYAQAIFEVARSENKIDQYWNDLQSVAQTFNQEEVKRYLDNPKTARDNKQIFVKGVLGEQISKPSLNLVLLLVQRQRQSDIDAVLEEYTRLANKFKGIEVAEVTTAVPLDEQEKEFIRQRLNAITGKDVQIQTRVDPSIIGGVIARIGDTQIDGSVRSRLQALRKQLA